MTPADRPAVSYAYDLSGRLQNITQGAQSFTYFYDILSRRTKIQRPNGVTTSYTYDEVNRGIRLLHADAQNQQIEDYRYSYSTDDEIVSITSLASAPLLPGALSVGQADAGNRIAQFGASSYGFDAEGRTQARTNPEGVTNYEWDARGRMTRAVLPDGQQINYGYDPLGRLTSRTANAATITYLYDGADVVLDRSSNGDAVDYLSGAGMDERLKQGDGLYFLQDHVRSTVGLTNAGGGVVERMRYEPFGESAGNSLTRYGFTGRERDAGTRLLYYRARWYDPQQGRFISEDPIGLAGGANQYAYAMNDPINNVDPRGLWSSKSHPEIVQINYGLGKVLVPTGRWISEGVHQISIDRVLSSYLSAKDRAILKEMQVVADKDQTAEGAIKHAMSSSGMSRSEARREANDFVRKELAAARRCQELGFHEEAMKHLGLAVHALQDATSPSHADFQPWEGWWQYPEHSPQEMHDPGAGSDLDRATERAYKYFTGELPMPIDFFLFSNTSLRLRPRI